MTAMDVHVPQALLGGSEVGRCLVRLHHDRYTPAQAVEDPVVERMLAQGISYEEGVLAAVDASHPEIADLRGTPHIDRRDATMEALGDGVPIVLGGRLEAPERAAVGLPDILVAIDGGYAPIEVKHHKVIGTSGPRAHVASLSDLRTFDVDDEVRFRSHRKRDLLQLAHYRALLEGVGHASHVAWGGVIGTDEPAVCLWVDLDRGEPSVSEMYETAASDAYAAIAHGRRSPDQPLHRPWLHSECGRCPWQDVCGSWLRSVDDPTLLRDVGRNERRALAEEAVTTVADIARLPLDTELVEGSAVMQARALSADTLLSYRPTGEPVPLAGAPVEVDFDIETHGGRVYLAGLLITENGISRFDPIADWSGSPDGERILLVELFDRFAHWPSDAILFQWTDYEVRTLTAAAERHGVAIEGYDSVAEWFDRHAVDLCAFSREHLVSPAGHSLKVIAPLAGFGWRDDDPGGLQSEIWFERLQGGDTDMRQRLLEYNEDDVRAQLAVRSFLRRSDEGSGPGSALPSVLTVP